MAIINEWSKSMSVFVKYSAFPDIKPVCLYKFAMFLFFGFASLSCSLIQFPLFSTFSGGATVQEAVVEEIKYTLVFLSTSHPAFPAR